MITQHQWMFLSSYTKIREKVFGTTLINMAHLGARAFEEISGEVVQTTSFVLRRQLTNDYSTTFIRLVDYSSQQAKETAFLQKDSSIVAKCNKLKELPGSALAYWISDNMLNLFKMQPADEVVTLREGIHTGKNEDFLRYWAEVDVNRFITDATSYEDLDAKGVWVPYNKGGSY